MTRRGRRDSPLPGAPPAFEKAITPLLISTYGATSGAVNAIALGGRLRRFAVKSGRSP